MTPRYAFIRHYTTTPLSTTRHHIPVLLNEVTDIMLHRPPYGPVTVGRRHPYLPSHTSPTSLSTKTTKPNKFPSSTTPRIILDGTFGTGNHSRKILDTDPYTVVIALDQDPAAYAHAQEISNRPEYRSRIVPVHGKYGCPDTLGIVCHVARTITESLRMSQSLDRTVSNIKSTLQLDHITHQYTGMKYPLIPVLHGMILDIGLSSPQIHDTTRGFTYRNASPLDMRFVSSGNHTSDTYGTRYTIPASTLLATITHNDLTRILHQYGDEPYARKIATAIITERDTNPIITTDHLTDTVLRALGKRDTWYTVSGTRHPAARTFQAIRIHVNNEYQQLRSSLHLSEHVLTKPVLDTTVTETGRVIVPGGRLCVISFHSGEDRITKRIMKSMCTGIPTTHHSITSPKQTMLSTRAKSARDAEIRATEAEELGLWSVARDIRYRYGSSGTTRCHVRPSLTTYDDDVFDENDLFDDSVPVSQSPKSIREDDTKYPSMTFVTKKPVTPSQQELETNPRSRSSKLRACERTVHDPIYPVDMDPCSYNTDE